MLSFEFLLWRKNTRVTTHVWPRMITDRIPLLSLSSSWQTITVICIRVTLDSLFLFFVSKKPPVNLSESESSKLRDHQHHLPLVRHHHLQVLWFRRSSSRTHNQTLNGNTTLLKKDRVRRQKMGHLSCLIYSVETNIKSTWPTCIEMDRRLRVKSSWPRLLDVSLWLLLWVYSFSFHPTLLFPICILDFLLLLLETLQSLTSSFLLPFLFL